MEVLWYGVRFYGVRLARTRGSGCFDRRCKVCAGA